ncbi:hypothetical protein JW835_03425 [bacterium]|nr:hypothetical protein [bacterium]
MNDVTRERDFYKRTCDEMGARLLQLQEEQTHIRQEARRSRMIATLIREVYQLADARVSFDEIGERFLYIILDTLGADRAALFRQSSGQDKWISTQLLGFKSTDGPEMCIDCQPPEFFYVNSSVKPDDVARCLCEKSHCKYLIWISNLDAGLALLICNETEDRHLHRPFEAADRGMAEDALNVFIEIAERKKAEEQVKASLKEKDVLLKELYHRTKNNMQVIRSMLALQANASDNEEVKRIFHDTENRIYAMSLVHQKLYQSQSLSSINICDYVHELGDLLLKSYHVSEARVSLDLNIQNFAVSIDIAIPCGLILNELLSNALKYAFPGGREGRVCIRLLKTDQRVIHIYFSDNGVGVPEGFEFLKQKSLGIRSVYAIVEHQLQGKVSCEVQNGVAFHIQFEDPDMSVRESK